MFEDEFTKLGAEPPRRLESLPGLRLRGSVPKMAILFPLLFVGIFAMMPLSLMHADPAMRLAMGPTESAQGRVISNTNASACRGEASHHITYAFSTPSGREYRGGANLCEQSPYYSVNPGCEGCRRARPRLSGGSGCCWPTFGRPTALADGIGGRRRIHDVSGERILSFACVDHSDVSWRG